jgi:hypothetical protein
VYVFAYSGLLPEWTLIDRFIDWKIKDVDFFSQLKISGTDIWIKQVGVFSSRELSPNAEYNSASIAP